MRGFHRYKPSKAYWERIGELDKEISERAKAAGQATRFVTTLADSFEAEAWWSAGGSSNPHRVSFWQHGRMSLGLPILGYLSTADTHLVVPAGATAGASGEHSSAGRHFHYEYPTPFGVRPSRLKVHELADALSEQMAIHLLCQGLQNSVPSLGVSIRPGREEYDLLLAQLQLGAASGSN